MRVTESREETWPELCMGERMGDGIQDGRHGESRRGLERWIGGSET